MEALTLTPKCICTCCFTVLQYLHTSLDKLTEVLITQFQFSDRERIQDNVLSNPSVCKIEKL